MDLKIFNSGKFGMITCPSCNGCGYYYNPDYQVCTSCGGFGLIKMEAERDTNISLDDD